MTYSKRLRELVLDIVVASPGISNGVRIDYELYKMLGYPELGSMDDADKRIIINQRVSKLLLHCKRANPQYRGLIVRNGVIFSPNEATHLGFEVNRRLAGIDTRSKRVVEMVHIDKELLPMLERTFAVNQMKSKMTNTFERVRKYMDGDGNEKE